MVEKRKEILEAVLYLEDISKRYFLVCHMKIVLYFLHKLKQAVVTSLNALTAGRFRRY